jgi:hypothetical protein
MHHFQSLVQIDSTGAPGTEIKVAEYVKKALEAEGISVTLVAKEPAHANVIARIKGNGLKKPLLIMRLRGNVQRAEESQGNRVSHCASLSQSDSMNVADCRRISRTCERP